MSRETKYYTASLDNLSKGITVFVFLLFGSIACMQINRYVNLTEDQPFWPLLITFVMFVLIIGITWSLRPLKYSLNPDRIIIWRPGPNVVLNVKDIRRIVPVTKAEMRWTARTFGNGGLFDYFGNFWNKKFGSMTWYATKRDNFLLLELRQGKKIVITPDDTGMISEIQKHHKRFEQSGKGIIN